MQCCMTLVRPNFLNQFLSFQPWKFSNSGDKIGQKIEKKSQLEGKSWSSSAAAILTLFLRTQHWLALWNPCARVWNPALWFFAWVPLPATFLFRERSVLFWRLRKSRKILLIGCLIEVGQTKSVALCNWPECESKTSVSQVLEDKERWISSLVYCATCKFYFLKILGVFKGLSDPSGANSIPLRVLPMSEGKVWVLGDQKRDFQCMY